MADLVYHNSTGATVYLSKVDIPIASETGTYHGGTGTPNNITLKVYPDNGSGKPDLAANSGTPLATVTVTGWAAVSTQYTKTFAWATSGDNFASKISVANGAKIHFVLEVLTNNANMDSYYVTQDETAVNRTDLTYGYSVNVPYESLTSSSFTMGSSDHPMMVIYKVS